MGNAGDNPVTWQAGDRGNAKVSACRCCRDRTSKHIMSALETCIFVPSKLTCICTPSCEHASKQTHNVSFGDFHLYTKSCEHANFINGITIQMPYYDAAIKQKTQNRLPKANHCLHLLHHQSVFRRGKAIIGNAQ